MAPRPLERCPACGAGDLRSFYEQPAVPANTCLLLADREEARTFPSGSLDLALCGSCGFIANRRFDPQLAEYSARYEETQSFSPTFTDFARNLAKHWVDKYDLQDRSILEIGCGKGEFLVLMCEAGAGRGIGIDPGTHPERFESGAAERIDWITDFFSEKYVHLRADAIVCRHTLEHIQPVGDFMRLVRSTIGDRSDTVVLFELPDVQRVLEEAAFWDVYYEHCSYFSAGSLARLFRATGFEVLDVSLVFDAQYLLVEARPGADGPEPHTAGEVSPLEEGLDVLAAAAMGFREGCEARVDGWRSALRSVHRDGGRAVIWGAGSKGVAFLQALGDEAGVIEYAVDVNPHKHGMFMAGTGQEIVPPSFLTSYDPALVVVMNPVYVEEIREELQSLGLAPRLESV